MNIVFSLENVDYTPMTGHMLLGETGGTTPDVAGLDTPQSFRAIGNPMPSEASCDYRPLRFVRFGTQELSSSASSVAMSGIDAPGMSTVRIGLFTALDTRRWFDGERL